MEKTKILPPLVRGKVTGVLDFFVDEIRLFRNILLLTDNFDLVLQIQWWGEVLPAYIRPKKLQVQGRSCKTTHTLESYYHSAKYEIKTTLDLFKLYLKTCEVVELSILEAVKNYVIGSAFLRDLINLLNKNNELIALPIFDCLGEQIGDMVIHINFLEVFESGSKISNSEMTHLVKKDYVGKKSSRSDITITTGRPNYSKEKIIFTDGHSKTFELGLPFDQYNFKLKQKEISNLPQVFNKPDSLLKKQEVNINNNLIREEEMETSCKCFPEVKTSTDSSKILCFGLNSQPSKVKSTFKNPNLKVANKFNSNSVKFKSKSKSMETLGGVSSEQSLCSRKVVKKTSQNSKNLSRKSITDKEKEFNSPKFFQKCSTAQPIFEHKQYKSCSTTSRSETVHLDQIIDCNIPLKESSKVLDYLLGSDMSKDDEKIALNDFKQMSPSQNLVKGINQLCLGSGQNLQKSKSKQDPSLSPSFKHSHLNFNFENPIERSYYEKFFLKTNTTADLEIAELLNQPENQFMLGKSNSQKATDLNSGSENSSIRSLSKHSNAEKEASDEEYLASNITGLNRKKDCPKCKYYKKLDELDTIIESLKHFEQKMLLDEKQMQSWLKENSDVVI